MRTLVNDHLFQLVFVRDLKIVKLLKLRFFVHKVQTNTARKSVKCWIYLLFCEQPSLPQQLSLADLFVTRCDVQDVVAFVLQRYVNRLNEHVSLVLDFSNHRIVWDNQF